MLGIRTLPFALLLSAVPAVAHEPAPPAAKPPASPAAALAPKQPALPPAEDAANSLLVFAGGTLAEFCDELRRS